MDLSRCIVVLTLLIFTVNQAAFSNENLRTSQNNRLGKEALKNDKPKRALAYFHAVLAVKPHHIQALKGCAKAYEELEQWGRAVIVYKKLNALRPRNSAILSRYLHVLEKGGILENRLEVLEALHKIHPQDLPIAVRYLKQMEASGIRQAHPKYILLLEDINSIPNVSDYLKRKLVQAQVVETREMDRNRISRDKQTDKFMKNVISVTRWEKTLIDSTAFQQKLIHMINEYPREMLFLEAHAILLFSQKRFSQALPALKHLKPKTVNINCMLGHIYFHYEDFARSAKYFNRVPRSRMPQAEWERFCDALLSANQKQKARREYESLIKTFPNSKEALSFLMAEKKSNTHLN